MVSYPSPFDVYFTELNESIETSNGMGVRHHANSEPSISFHLVVDNPASNSRRNFAASQEPISRGVARWKSAVEPSVMGMPWAHNSPTSPPIVPMRRLSISHEEVEQTKIRKNEETGRSETRFHVNTRPNSELPNCKSLIHQRGIKLPCNRDDEVTAQRIPTVVKEIDIYLEKASFVLKSEPAKCKSEAERDDLFLKQKEIRSRSYLPVSIPDHESNQIRSSVQTGHSA